MNAREWEADDQRAAAHEEHAEAALRRSGAAHSATGVRRELEVAKVEALLAISIRLRIGPAPWVSDRLVQQDVELGKAAERQVAEDVAAELERAKGQRPRRSP